MAGVVFGLHKYEGMVVPEILIPNRIQKSRWNNKCAKENY